MKERTRKTICLIIAAAALFAALMTGLRLMSGYAHTIPLVIGPYKQALLLMLALVFLTAVFFAYRPLTAQTLLGALGITAGVLWFTGRMLLAYRSPESSLLFRLDQWMPLPLMGIGAGTALWCGELFPKGRIRIPRKWQPVLVLLLMFICLQPALNGSFNWDDSFFSVQAQAMRISGESIFLRVWQEIVDYVKIGRINPFATFHFLVFYFVPSAAAYKLLLVILTLLGGLLFYRFLREWGENSRTALLALLITALCFQLRLYHDPLNSYYGLMQVMFIELMGSLILFVRWMRENRPVHLIFSLLLFAMGLTSYEMFFPLTALVLICALSHEKKLLPAIRRALPHILLAVLLFGLSMLLRRNITDETAYNGTTFSTDIKAVLTALTYQLRAAFPLSYRTAGYDAALFGERIPWYSLFSTSVLSFLRSIRWQDLIACLILIGIVNNTDREKEADFSWMKLLFALSLWILPGLVISLSEKYQHDLYPGVAYLPVFFSYFGAALLLEQLGALFGKLIAPRTLRLILSGAGCAILLITLADNRAISERLNGIFLYPRAAGEAALQAGILDENADSDQTVISCVPYSLWEHGWMLEPYQAAFYSVNARRPVNAIGVRDFVTAQDPETVWLTPDAAVLISYSGEKDAGFAKSGRLRGTGFDFETNSLAYPVTSDVFFYVSGKYQQDTTLIYETRDGEWKQLSLSGAWLVRETAGGTLYKLQETVPVLFDTIGILK